MIYIGRYRIVGDDLFKEVNEARLRYVDGRNNAKRPLMPEDRRREKIEEIFNEYLEFLKRDGRKGDY